MTPVYLIKHALTSTVIEFTLSAKQMDRLIHLQEEGEEVCIYKPHNNYWIPVDADEVDIPG